MKVFEINSNSNNISLLVQRICIVMHHQSLIDLDHRDITPNAVTTIIPTDVLFHLGGCRAVMQIVPELRSASVLFPSQSVLPDPKADTLLYLT